MGSDAIKNTIALLAVVASAAAAFFSYMANEEARAAKEKATELSRALDSERHGFDVFRASLPYFERMEVDHQDRVRHCKIIVQLGHAERESTGATRIATLLREFIENVPDGDDLPFRMCEQSSEALIAAVQPTQLSSDSDANTDGLDRIGKWHAVLSSYRTSSCQLALDAAERFTAALETDVVVYRTTISNHYAVVIDAGDKKALADEWVSNARAVGQDAVQRIQNGEANNVDKWNLQYLVQAFAQENKGWILDDACKIG